VVRSGIVAQTFADRLATWKLTRSLAWPLGEASMNDIGVEDVVAAVTTLLPEPTVAPAPVSLPVAKPAPSSPAPKPTLRTLDLREGSFRYEVVAMDAASAAAALPAAEPATKPLAQAH
jgi:hypothetical protein